LPPQRDIDLAMTIRALLAAVLVCACAAPSTVQAATPKSTRAAPQQSEPSPTQVFPNAEAIARWIAGYRVKPDPDRLPAAVKAMSATGIFKDSDTAGLYLGFSAGVLGSRPEQAAVLAAKMFPLPPEDHLAVIKIIAYSGLPNWKVVLSGLAERMPARAPVVDRYLTDKLPALANLALDAGPTPLDVLWGQYYATGSFEPILRIVSILPWSKDGNNVDRLTVGSMAKWTLAQNASRDMDLLQLLKVTLPHETKSQASTLREVIEAAEIGEVGKIRTAALAQIESRKVKGSTRLQDYNWWSQAGQTVLAAGCIAAGALGQVQAGIPCVIGGALSSATLKALTPKD
jgi:hypothetical protein